MKTRLIGFSALYLTALLLSGAQSTPQRPAPFKVGDTVFPSYQAFKDSGRRCPVPTPSADELQRIENDLALTR